MKKASHTQTTHPEITRVEFFRNGLVLMPDPKDRHPGIAFFLAGKDLRVSQQFCTCTLARKKKCPHQKRLQQIIRKMQKDGTGKPPDEAFRSSIWYHLAAVLSEGPAAVDLSLLNFKRTHIDEVDAILAVGPRDEPLLQYLSTGPDRGRFLERFSVSSKKDEVLNRAWALSRLEDITRTDNEKIMNERGIKTRKQVLEQGFWFRLAYHAYREMGNNPDEKQSFILKPAISEHSGTFTVTCIKSDGSESFRMVIARDRVKSLLSAMKDRLPNQHQLAIYPIPLKSIFKITQNTELDLEIRPQIQLLQKNGEARFFENRGLKKFTYGSLVYLRDMGIMAELEDPEHSRKFKAPTKMVLKKSEVPTFLETHEEAFQEGSFVVDAPAESVRIIKDFDWIQIRPESLEQDWYWLSVQYGFGNQHISLSEILQTRKSGQRYIGTPSGWIDCGAESFEDLEDLLGDIEVKEEADAQKIRLSRLDLLRLQARNRESIKLEGGNETTRLLKKMLGLKPAQLPPDPKGLKSVLRNYQQMGMEWIHFLFQNGFGGLLCDDMGLGKTHQVMGFLTGVLQTLENQRPFIVVCPTTVLSHWKNLVKRYAPSLKPIIYHGAERDISQALEGHHLVLTSYGILRRDVDVLETLDFSVAIFDEIQNLKNPATQMYQSAERLHARMKLGLTGTPIENRLEELKALLDLTLPGYLGRDRDFENRYVKPILNSLDEGRKTELKNIIKPFTLRRKKESVLLDLPEKIEDIRTCTLSEDQIKLYRDAISKKGKDLMKSLSDDQNTIPYIHIFALLNLLKQICNHPALLSEEIDAYQNLESGKWDLFQELLAESLESGQKVVIYSQFLNMIRIMEQDLKQKDISFVSLTGKDRQPGKGHRSVQHRSGMPRFCRQPQSRRCGYRSGGGLGRHSL